MNYQHLSAGYLGEHSANSTLNSQFYADLFENLSASNNTISSRLLFPQRIPKIGFFEELCRLETDDFNNNFDNTLKTIKSNYYDAIKNYHNKKTEVNYRACINWINILMRFGCFYEIHHYSIEDINSPEIIEILILQETNNIEICLSNDSIVTVDNFLYLAKKYLDHTNVKVIDKISLLSRIVVDFYRHQKKSDQHSEILNYSEILLNLTNNLEKNSYTNLVYSSISYRGLAMVKEFGWEKQQSLLIHAIEIARSIPKNSKIDTIIANENLYNCLQTTSKWFLQNKNPRKELDCLLEMIELDPFDSTGFSELGLCYSRIENYEDAALAFKKAMELGPPNPGMNAYFYANCLEKLGKNSEAIDYLYESTKLDKYGVSAWLDILDYYLRNKQLDKAKEVAKHIYKSPDLQEQLDESEIIAIQNLI